MLAAVSDMDKTGGAMAMVEVLTLLVLFVQPLILAKSLIASNLNLVSNLQHNFKSEIMGHLVGTTASKIVHARLKGKCN